MGLMAGASRLRRGRFDRGDDIFFLRPDHLLAVDEESRRRLDLVLLLGGEAAGEDLVLQSVVLEAGLDLVLAHAAELGDAGNAGNRILGETPRALLGEEHADEAVEALRRGAARDD